MGIVNPVAPANLHRWILIGLFLLIVCMGGWFSFDARNREDESIRRVLLRQASNVAATISPDDIRELSFTAEDADRPAFQRITTQLRAYAEASGTRSLYTMRLRDGEIFFGPESLLPGDPYATPPGTRYLSPSPYNFEAFRTAKSLVFGPVSDEFGEFVSANVPIIDPRSGKVLLVLGQDVETVPWRAQILKAQWAPLLAMLIPMGLLLLGYTIYKVRKKPHPSNAKDLRNIQISTHFGVLLALTLIAALFVRNSENKQLKDHFLSLVETKGKYYTDSFKDIDRDLDMLIRFFEASENVTREEFETFCRPLLENDPVESCVWLPAVPASETPEFEARMRAQGQPDFSIRRFAGTPTGTDPLYPAVYVEPASMHSSMLGYDFYSDPLLRDALLTAVQSGNITASDMVASPAASRAPTGLFVFDPIPRSRDGGFVGVSIHLEKMIVNESSTVEAEASKLSATLFELHAGKPPMPLSCSACEGDAPLCQDMLKSTLSASIPVFAFGKPYMVLFTPEPQWFAANRHNGEWATLATGITLSLLLTYLFSILLNRPHLLETLVQQRTHELAELQERCDIATSAASIGIWERDIANSRLIWDERMYRIYGLDEKTFDGAYQTWTKCIHPDDRERTTMEIATAEIAATKQGKNVFNTDFRIIRPDGEIRHIQTVGRVVHADGGKTSKVTGVNIDITERKRTEEQIADLARFPAEINNPVLRISKDGTLLYRNAASACLERSLAGAREGDPLPETWCRHIRKTFSNGTPHETELENECRAYSVTLVPSLERGYVNVYAKDITELKRQTKALRTSEEKMRTTLTSIGDAVISTDASGRIELMNPFAETLTGWTLGEASGKSLREVFPIFNEITRDPIPSPVDRVLRTGKIVELANHTMLRSREGHEIPIADSGAPIHDADGRISGVVLVFRDQTKERAARKAIEDSEARYRLLFNNMTSGFALHEMVYDNDGNPVDYRYLQVNPLFTKMIGLPPEQVIGRTAREILPNIEDHWFKPYVSVVQTGRPIRLENYSQDLGKYFEVHAFSPAPDQFAVIFNDVSERVKAQQDIELTANRLRRAQQVAQVGDWEFDLQNNTVSASDEAKRIYGLAEELWTIPEVQKIPLRKYRSMLNSALEGLVRAGIPYDVEFTIKRPTDGALRDIHSVAEYDPEKQVVFGVIQDVTDRKQVELALARSEAKYRDLFEQSADAFLILKEGRFVDCNQAAVDLLRFNAKEQLLNTHPADLSPECQPDGRQSREKAEEIIKRVGEERTMRFEWLHQRADGEIFPAEVSLTAITDSKGSDIIHTVWRDITEQKRMQEAIQKRIVALTQPMGNSEEIDFDALFNLEEIQRIQDEFADATGVASVITRPDGTPITRHSNSTRLCMEVIRGTEKGCANCFKSDAILGRIHPEGPVVQTCLSGGLWDAGASIIVGGKHVASWLIGQVRDETQTEEHMRAYAREIGVDETTFMEAFREVPTIPREQFDQIAQALFTLANQLSTTAYQNIQQARFIAAEKKAKDELRESEERFKSLHNASFGGILIHHQGIVVECNLGLSIMTGYSQEELIGMNGLLLIAEESRELVMDKIRTGSDSPYEATGLRKNGERYPVRLEARNVTYKGLKVRTVEFRDITEQKKAEAELRRLSAAIEQSAEAIVITDTDGCIQYVNPAFETTTGYTIAEALGKTPSLLKSSEHPDSFYENLWQTISNGRTWEGKITNRRKDGTLFTEEASIAPIKDAGQIVNYVAVKRDITEDLVLEAELRQAQKMDAIGQLAGGIAHDFNNILQGILGFSDLLRSTLEKSSQEYQNVEEIQKSAKRAAKLTQQLLTFSRKQAVQLMEVDLNNAVHDTEALLHVLLGNRHELVVELQPHLPPIHADHGQLSQIIMNLAVNARDAMPTGGRLSIATERIQIHPHDAAQITGARSGDFLCLSVTDTGHGMDAETKKRIFEPFFTTKKLGSGTGLGLAVVFGIVEQSKGWINVYSEEGKGTCFKVYLPVSHEHQEAPTSEGSPGKTQQVSILFVEDDPDMRQMVINVLDATDHRVETANTAEEGFELFTLKNGHFDLLMSDVELPGMSGDELADKLRSTHPDLPVLLLSGYADHTSRWKHFAEKNYLFLGKPFTITGLLDAVFNILKPSPKKEA